MLASALTVALSGYRAVATSWSADTAGRQDEIDVGQDIVDTVRMMFDSASMQKHRGFCATIESRCLNNPIRRHACNLSSDLRGVAHHPCLRLLPIVCAQIDEVLVDQLFLDQDVQHSIREGDISSRFQLQMEIALTSSCNFTRIDNDPTATVVALLPEEFIQNGECFPA